MSIFSQIKAALTATPQRPSVCYRHFWGIGDPVVPCPDCGATVDLQGDRIEEGRE